jgi:hypothetical protein
MQIWTGRHVNTFVTFVAIHENSVKHTGRNSICKETEEAFTKSLDEMNKYAQH